MTNIVLLLEVCVTYYRTSYGTSQTASIHMLLVQCCQCHNVHTDNTEPTCKTAVTEGFEIPRLGLYLDSLT